ncbi:3'-5' exonuclease [Candidatus Arthromitus sp. SFB-rat-Yit]|uniref:3'-5' exonuclease n=1 Tax=Candidatus Arthromitus sp. SFB-rat-Yit TaxID=1041504 RepID=UPI000227A57B|nr:3'-5' exonuclease [Candidatus Arthromitus sp. SFB-rat-Yit]BAK81623.1 exonuclease [Candidatus Arthromitus sp. SFB-rat-Yit]
MRLLFLDTETTDKSPGQICQLTYIIYDTDLPKENRVQAKNFFFSVDFVTDTAYNVHGFNIDILKKLSGNLKFKDLYKLFKKDLLENDFIIGHNVNFDISFLKREFDRIDIEFKPKNLFCSMNYFKNILKLKNSIGTIKSPKLSELLDHLKITEDNILSSTTKLFNSDETHFHDARFDTTALYLAIIKSIKLNLISNGFFSSQI